MPSSTSHNYVRQPECFIARSSPTVLVEDGLSIQPPKLPPIQLITHKSSFADMFSAVNDTGMDNKKEKRTSMRQRVKLWPPASEMSNAGGPPFDSFNHSDNHTSAQLPSSGLSTIQEHQHTTPSRLRYTSSGSSTLRSQVSDGTPVRSRPSSRSSVDEAPSTPYKSLIQTERDHSERTETPSPPEAADKLSPRPQMSLMIENNGGVRIASNVMLYKNKPLPPEPRVVPVHASPLQMQRSALGSIRVTTPEPRRTKRGERLGQQMTRTGTNEPESQPLRPATIRQSRSKATAISNSPQGELLPTGTLTQLKTSSRGSFHSSTPERILLRVLSSLESLDDLQCTSMVNKGLHRTFKRYEKDLVSCVLFQSSRPAWELRQIMKREQKRNAFKLCSVQRDAATIHALQSFMLMKCEALCKQTTIEGLLGRNLDRKEELDNALWRIWIFCKLFGKNQGHENSFKSQLVWLNGGERKSKDNKIISLGVANGKGLTTGELEDISEMWSCLETLLAGFRNREDEARGAGIFNSCVIDGDDGTTERALLNSWIYDILSLGPKGVLTLISCSFEQAKVLGITNWTPPEPGKTRGLFLKGAIEYIYRERLVSEARSKALRFERAMRSQPISNHSLTHAPTVTESDSIPRNRATGERKPSLRVATDILPKPVNTPPMETGNRDQLTSNPKGPHRTSQAPDTPVFSAFAMTHGASARLGATLFPMQYPNKQSRLSTVAESTRLPSATTNDTNSEPRIIDPVDAALRHLVRDRKFPETQAKHALAMSDNGTGVDIQRAVHFLTNQPVSSTSRTNQRMSELPSTPLLEACADEDKHYLVPDRMPPTPPRTPATARKLLRKSNRVTLPVHPVDADIDAEPVPYRQVSGYMHVPIQPPAGLSHSASMGAGQPNRTSLSQKFKMSLRQSSNIGPATSQTVQHDKPDLRRSSTQVPGYNTSYRASTMPGFLKIGSATSWDNIYVDMEAQRRPSQNWTPGDANVKRSPQVDNAIYY